MNLRIFRSVECSIFPFSLVDCFKRGRCISIKSHFLIIFILCDLVNQSITQILLNDKNILLNDKNILLNDKNILLNDKNILLNDKNI